MTSIIILAAGASTRLGRSKQTLPYKDSTLLNHTIEVALNSALGPVLVVVGANQEEILPHIQKEQVEIIVNTEYAEGIASSIRAGIGFVQEHLKQCNDVILMVCDQPHVDQQLLKSLVNVKAATGKPLAACVYKETVGVPALFDKQFFSHLLSLNGEEGGKKILMQNIDSIATVPFPLGEVDIDTDADADALGTI